MKIAILGSAPSSLPLAPFKDPTWEIWGCSPGCAQFIRNNGLRIDRWFEIHHFIPPDNEFKPDYIDWMKSLAPKPVYMIKSEEQIPNSVPYPKNRMVEEFGPFFWSSSVAYQLGLAISILSRAPKGEREIGLWGVDMAHVSEWAQQRPACQHFIQVAWDRGIKVSTPPQSDLLWPSPMYGYHEAGPRAIKLYTRQKEMSAKLAEAEAKHAQAEREMFFLKGVCDSNQYHINNMAEEPDWSEPMRIEEPTALVSPAMSSQDVEAWRVAQGLPSDEERRAHVAAVTNGRDPSEASKEWRASAGLPPPQEQGEAA